MPCGEVKNSFIFNMDGSYRCECQHGITDDVSKVVNSGTHPTVYGPFLQPIFQPIFKFRPTTKYKLFLNQEWSYWLPIKLLVKPLL